MMFYLTAKTFQDVFLVNERDNDILNAQYVIVSTRIRVRDKKTENIVNGTAMLFPDANVCAAMTDADLRDRYFEQLLKCGPFISSLIKGSIEEKYNIIFINTKKEEHNIKYLKYLSEFIYFEHGYPVYEYGNYAIGASQLLKYNKKKVIAKADKILSTAKAKGYRDNLQSEYGRKAIMKDYKSMTKKELKKILKQRDLYQDDMDKKDMLEMLEVFM